ncbi:hypothetical protein [uncultured Victivallis sp.]|uniref:hypothetical protein n=1 Tax=uncultured Victivallis sp. TaxID=354118 RepID=UPI0025DC3A01|nr:hypothetical protein [uncultured Victivallis sp.]
MVKQPGFFISFSIDNQPNFLHDFRREPRLRQPCPETETSVFHGAPFGAPLFLRRSLICLESALFFSGAIRFDHGIVWQNPEH